MPREQVIKTERDDEDYKALCRRVSNYIDYVIEN